MAPMSSIFALEIHYDQEGDVLYASIEKPKPALSLEVDTDILLRYVPPDPAPVGVTVVSFLAHFPRPPQVPLLEHAQQVVSDLLTRYPEIPKDDLC